MRSTLKNICALVIILLFQNVAAQDATQAIKDAGLDIEVSKAGLTVPDAVEKAKDVGYSDQDILNAIEKTKNEGKAPEEAGSDSEEKKTKESLGGSKYFRELQNAVFESYNIVKTPKYRLFSLPPFGYEIFNNPAVTFEPLDYAPADPNYQIGTDDELMVSLYGEVQYSGTYKVDREGKINLPEAGMVIVNGLTLIQAHKKIVERLSQIYAGIRSKAISVDVTTGKLKRIKIFVTDKGINSTFQ